jgi:glycosidase
MRGSMNNWAAQDEYAFQYHCDAYYLNVNLKTRHEFKIADASWTDALTFGPFASDFAGEHTVRFAMTGGKPVFNVGKKTFVDPLALPVTDPIAKSLRFDSRNIQDKKPFGAVAANSTIEFTVTAKPGVQKLTLFIEKRRMEGNQEVLEYAEIARVPLARNTSKGMDHWTGRFQFPQVSVYGYWFEAKINGKNYVYENNKDSVFWTREKGSGGLGAVAELAPGNVGIRRFRQTVYDPQFKVPDWAADVVYYYIFPDRFRNGDRRNDPKPGVDRYQDTTVELHTNWLDKPWKPGTGDGSDKTYNNDFFGGDLAGIIEKLDYIKELGANTIYMTPIFKAASNHKYDTADYKQIDPAFGNTADFERLTSEATKRGIRVIPDTSLNHVGNDSIYFDRFGNHQSEGAFKNGTIQPQSPYAQWFTFDTAQSETDKQYKGWVGISDLPEINKASRSFRNYAYRDADSVMKLWLDRGAAGWRMDVAPWVPDDFWREWRTAIKQHRPDALTVAETWFDSSKYFLGDMFDSTMNYIFRNAVLDYAAGGDAVVLYPNIELMREAYPPQSFYALMNLLSTHDQARGLHQFGWHGDTTDAEVIALAKQRLKLAVFFQMTFPGSPAVYYGDEVAVTGGDDPYNRATYPWADQGGKPDLDMLAEFKRLIKMRNDHEVLRRGTIDAPVHLNQHTIVLLRRHQKEVAITATNNSSQVQHVSVKVPADFHTKVFTNALTGERLNVVSGEVALTIPPLYGVVVLGSNTAPSLEK